MLREYFDAKLFTAMLACLRSIKGGVLVQFRKALVVVTMLLAVTVIVPTAMGTSVNSPVSRTSEPPNIIFILTDDLSVREMKHHPKLRNMIGGKEGAELDGFTTNSLCCPSRASILTGTYTHNNNVKANKAPAGGRYRFWKEGHEKDSLGRWMYRAGYRTSYIGKYLNGYTKGKPVGWASWYGYSGYYKRQSSHPFFWKGKKRYVKRGNDTDQMRRFAVREIKASKKTKKPLFLTVATNAPHSPSIYSKKDSEDFSELKVPRTPAYRETDLSDKPKWVRERPPISKKKKASMDLMYRDRQRAMKSVTRLTDSVIQELKKTGELDNTYIVFTSDNGFRFGEHGIGQGKTTAYEEDIRVPLYVRGPGIPGPSKPQGPALLIDLAPTFLDWADASKPADIDGRSLAPFLWETERNQRKAFLVEGYNDREGYHHYVPTYRTLRGKDFSYTEYPASNGYNGRELYDLNEDPYQLKNLLTGDYSEQEVSKYSQQLEKLYKCRGRNCRTIEDAG